MAFSKEKIELLLARIVRENRFGNLYVAPSYHGSHGVGYIMGEPRLTYVMDGTFQLDVGSGEHIRRREFRPGETLVMKPYCLTGGVWSKRHETCALVLHADYLRIVHARHETPGVPLSAPSDFYHLRDQFRTCTSRVFEALCALRSGAEACAVGGDLLRVLFTLLLEDVRNSSVNDAGRAYLLWARMADRVSSSFSENLTREKIAGEFSVTGAYVSKLFRRYSGSAFVDYLRTLRLKHARMLLNETNLTVSEIAWNCGFQSPSYFIRCFRAAEGASPGLRRRR